MSGISVLKLLSIGLSQCVANNQQFMSVGIHDDLNDLVIVCSKTTFNMQGFFKENKPEFLTISEKNNEKSKRR